MSETKYVISWPIACCLMVTGGLITIGAQHAIAAYDNVETPAERDALKQYKMAVDSCWSATEREVADFDGSEACKDMVHKRLDVRARTQQQLGNYIVSVHQEMDIYRRITYDVFDLR